MRNYLQRFQQEAFQLKNKMNLFIAKFQIGKNGITTGVINSLALALKNHRQVRVSMLKSSGRDRNSVHETAEQIKEKLQVKIEYKIIGFTIIIKKLANSRKHK